VEKAPEPDAGAAPATQENVPPQSLPRTRNPEPAEAGARVLAAVEARAVRAMAAVAVAAGEGADMPRPFCKRFVGWQPGVSLFKPAGIPAGELEIVVLSLDEVEALRLADLNGEYQEAAAERMKISRATFARIVESARRKVADALVHGKALQIQTEPGAQPPTPATAPGECHRRGCGCKGHGQGRGRFVEYPAPKEEPK
jgi:uncharacterized protein